MKQTHHENILAGWTGIALHVVPFILFLLPEIATAADYAGFSSVTDILKTVAKLLFLEWGYYIAIIAGAFLIFLAWSGRLEWIKAIGFAVAVVLFFAVPGIIASMRDSASSSF